MRNASSADSRQQQMRCKYQFHHLLSITYGVELTTKPKPNVSTHNNNRSSMSSPQPSAAETVPLENLDTLQQILSFVGIGHYLFVAATNRKFHEVYSALFPGDQETRLNASTEALARFCWEEIHHEIMSDADTSQKATTLIGSAATHGNLPGLQFLRSVGCPWNEETCRFAALSGYLAVLQWCRENGCPWDERTCASAAKHGQLTVLQWCRENGCPWDEETCAFAAFSGNLAVLQWCRENGCPWNEETCACAAICGNLTVLQWCRENGCSWDERTFRNASRNGHDHIVEYCRENGCPMNGE